MIDLDKTLSKITLVFSVLKEIIKNGGNIFLVGNCRETSLFTGALGRSNVIPFVNTKWVGGTLTNWDVFHERLDNSTLGVKAKNKIS